MRKQKLIPAALAVALGVGVAGCESNAGNGALIGGAAGAGLGAAIGHQSHSTLGGAVVGGALGAIGGAIVGNEVDRHEEREYDRRYYEDERYYYGRPRGFYTYDPVIGAYVWHPYRYEYVERAYPY